MGYYVSGATNLGSRGVRALKKSADANGAPKLYMSALIELPPIENLPEVLIIPDLPAAFCCTVASTFSSKSGTCLRAKFHEPKINFWAQKKLRLQKLCIFTENSDSVVGSKIWILKIHDEVASFAHSQQAPVPNLFGQFLC